MTEISLEEKYYKIMDCVGFDAASPHGVVSTYKGDPIKIKNSILNLVKEQVLDFVHYMESPTFTNRRGEKFKVEGIAKNSWDLVVKEYLKSSMEQKGKDE